MDKSLTKVFLTLLSQLLVTFFVAYALQSHDVMKEWYWVLLLFIVMMILVFCIFNTNFSVPLRLTLFTVFSGIFGVLLSRIPKQYNKAVMASIVGTISIFVFLFFAGMIITSYGYNLNWMSGILLAALVGLIVAEIVCYVFDVSKHHKVLIIIGLIIYSLFVIYDTNVILRTGQDFISSALFYYTDVIGIFTNILELNNK